MLDHLHALLVADASLMRDSLAALLGTEGGVEVIGAVANSAHAIKLVTAVRVDVAIVDLAPESGAQTVAALRDRWPSVRVLALTSSEDERVIDAVLRAGVDGCLLRTDTRAELMTALRRLSEGHRYVSRSIRDRLGSQVARGGASLPVAEGLALLTDREREVMQCVASGLRTREIAERLSLSEKTVEKHRSNLMRKLGLRSAAAVAAYAIAKRYGRA
ncbi:MAG: response regulator transcription factor [Gammaproteobacteria bacterium]|nr:response regulator transcription factor [Gammaproteobacteria bacterium]